GSTRFLTDESGTVTDTCRYDAWGNTVAETGTTTMSFKWVGKYGYYADESTTQVYVRARMYQPTVARWISIDPQFDETNVAFAYGTNRPVSHLDSSGLLTWESLTLETGPCGMYHWPVRFIPESERQGWILQEVSFWFDIGQCDSAVSIKSQPCRSGKITGNSGAVELHTYWEIWYVTKSGDIATAGRLRRSPSKNRVFDEKSAVVGGGMDYFGFNGGADTCVEETASTQTGKVYFLRGNIIPPEFLTQSGRPLAARFWG
ncbi:MAG: RHS repeat-associated core domain-containing protein, partial [Planctomycetaceae bacterium]|nr:RHS repeat-associated core domain-containing protein [Planctomycetaceae bacterium]